MLKKDIKFTDFNGVERTETHYFNLTKSELIELELSETGGYAETMVKLAEEATDGKEIMRRVKELILGAYGIRTEDGSRFIKTPQIQEEFSQTAAYDALFFELATGATASAEFIKAVMPADINTEEYQEKVSEIQAKTVELPKDDQAEFEAWKASKGQ